MREMPERIGGIKVKKIKSGFAFHCHHDILVEWAYDFDERVKVIKLYKPKKERPLRLRLFKMIPTDRSTINLTKFLDARDKAWKSYAMAREAYTKEFNKHTKYFIELHKELCPNCPWDGKTIFLK